MSKLFRKKWSMMQKTANKQQVFEYLDDLRESGVTNMFGARPYIVSEFGVDQNEAKKLLMEWMSTFEQRHPQTQETDPSRA